MAFGLLLERWSLVDGGEWLKLVTDRLQVLIQGFFQQAALLCVEISDHVRG